MTTREEVYLAIDTERDYQDRHTLRDDLDGSEPPFTQGEYIVMMQKYVDELPHMWAVNAGAVVDPVQHNMRKIAAIAVQCMEYHGALVRDDVGEWGQASMNERWKRTQLEGLEEPAGYGEGEI